LKVRSRTIIEFSPKNNLIFEKRRKKEFRKCNLFFKRRSFEFRHGGATTGHRAGRFVLAGEDEGGGVFLFFFRKRFEKVERRERVGVLERERG